MIRILIGIALGGALGAFLGWKGRCATGACPLTSNPWLGGLWGAMLGALVVNAFFSTTSLFSGSGAGTRNSNTRSDRSMTTTASMVNLGRTEDFQTVVLEASIPVLVDFWAVWCGPCRMQGRVLEELAPRINGDALIVKVNVDEHPDLARRYNVSSIPTLMVFREGSVQQRMVGMQSIQVLQKALGLSEG